MTKNKDILAKLIDLGVFETVPVGHVPTQDETEIIVTDDRGAYERAVIDKELTNEELLIMVEAEKLKTLKYIMYMVMFFVVITVIGIGISVFTILAALF